MRPPFVLTAGLLFLGVTLLELGFLLFRILPLHHSSKSILPEEIVQRPVAGLPRSLRLSGRASPAAYSQVGQWVTYTYAIANTGPTTLGPAQFTIDDNRFGTPIVCGPAEATLAPTQTLRCSAHYIITELDLTVEELTNTVRAFGAGQTSAPLTISIVKLPAEATQTATIPTATIAPPLAYPPPVYLPPGSPIQHQVIDGEWLSQIATCYGARLEEVQSANPEIADPTATLLAPASVTVPGAGSAGRVYGPPCIAFHTVQSGDTWNSIAQSYNADLAELQRVNPVPLTAGATIKVPLNSGGGAGVVLTPAYVSADGTPETTTAAPRITFDPGSTTASHIGVLEPDETLRYVVAAEPGQQLTVLLRAPPDEVSLEVKDPGGLALKPADTAYFWSGMAGARGDYTIILTGLSGSPSKSYILEVSFAASTPLPASGPPIPGSAPTLVIEVEWPTRLEVGLPGTIRISLLRPEGDAYEPRVQVAGNTLSPSTAMPVPVGTEGVGPERAFGAGYDAFVLPVLSAATLRYDPPQPVAKPLGASRMSWEWSISSKEVGAQTVNVSMEIEWRSRDGAAQQRALIWDPEEPLRIEVVQPLITMGQLSVSTLVTGLLGSALSFPFLYGIVKERQNKPQQKPRRKPRAG